MSKTYTYKDDGHDGEDHDGLALAHRFLSLLHGFVSLNNTGLLLLEAEQFGHLCPRQ